jgi:hypothetical protein
VVYEHISRSLPLWLLRAYLVELGGAAMSDEYVRGPGWEATLEKLAAPQASWPGGGPVRLMVRADESIAAELFPLLDQKLSPAEG